ncbi:hypothetical protein [Chryseobacterium sp. CT-SW4]|uniref:hypothetical protein n=1 Tax=Chryseobacterium sp. SW-1 TaxID=3157343 RepID=UPI003B0135C4
MKKLLLSLFVSTSIALVIISCTHTGKDTEVAVVAPIQTDEIEKSFFVDDYGDKMEVSINKTKNTVVVHLNDKTFELKKSDVLPEFTATNELYQYSNIKGDITLLKKDINMVLFHTKVSPSKLSASK